MFLYFVGCRLSISLLHSLGSLLVGVAGLFGDGFDAGIP